MRVNAINKQASQLFDAWQLNQDVFTSYNFSAKRNQERLQRYCDSLRNDYQEYPGVLMQINAILVWRSRGTVNNVGEFVTFLEQHDFCSKVVYQEELLWSIHKIIKKYNALLRLLFIDHSQAQQKKLLYFLANDFFFFCFDTGNKRMIDMVQDEASQPLARMLYAAMWVHLGARGWQSWHQEIFHNLKQVSSNGGEIVYIAGGSDINQLLKHGIYNIRIIDPFLPTQDTYYSRGWRFLVKGALQDTITWSLGAHLLLLTRRVSKEHGFFAAKLANGRTRRIPESHIVWDISDTASHKCGQLTIERRFTVQKDFYNSANRVALISFNELYFITTAHEDGWGIDLAKLDSAFLLYVKQLSRPLTKKMLLNIRKLDQLFEFIQLGNCIN